MAWLVLQRTAAAQTEVGRERARGETDERKSCKSGWTSCKPLNYSLPSPSLSHIISLISAGPETTSRRGTSSSGSSEITWRWSHHLPRQPTPQTRPGAASHHQGNWQYRPHSSLTNFLAFKIEYIPYTHTRLRTELMDSYTLCMHALAIVNYSL